MLKPIDNKQLDKPKRQPLVHHPSDALDGYCHCDVSDRRWVAFDASVSHQLLEFEFANRRYIRVQQNLSRRSSF